MRYMAQPFLRALISHLSSAVRTHARSLRVPVATQSSFLKVTEPLVVSCGHRRSGRKFVDSLNDNISSFEDLYGFVYEDSRDLSGFIDG